MLATLPIGATECTTRRKAVLADWVAFGHSESELRRLVKGEIAIGPDKAAAFAAPKTAKRR